MEDTSKLLPPCVDISIFLHIGNSKPIFVDHHFPSHFLNSREQENYSSFKRLDDFSDEFTCRRKYNQFFAAHAVSQLISDPDGIGSTHLEFVHGKPRLTGFRIDKEIQGTTYLVPRMIGVKELGVYGNLLLRSNEKLPEFEREFAVEIQEVNDVEGQVICGLMS